MISSIKKKFALTVIFLMLSNIFLNSISSATLIYDYTKPNLENTETGNQKVQTDTTQKDFLYTNEDGQPITDQDEIDKLSNPESVNSVVGSNVKIPVVATQINFLGFVTPSNDNSAVPAFWRYFQKNWLISWNWTPYKTYTDSYYTYLRMSGNQNDLWEYKTAGLDLLKKWLLSTTFIQRFRLNGSDLSNGSYVKLIDPLDNEYSFFLDDNDSKFTVNWIEVSRNAYFDPDTGELKWPNVFVNLNGEQNLEVSARTINNNDWTSDLNIQLWRQINKNVIVYNGLGSEYDMVFRKHEYGDLDNTTWYWYVWHLAKYNVWKSKSTLAQDYVDRLYYNTTYDMPRVTAEIKPIYDDERTDYYLPVSIYNWTIIMDVFPTHDNNYFWIVSDKNAQRRMNLIMWWENNSVQIGNGDGHTWTAVCPNMLDHGYNEWYRLVYDIQTRNGKQIIKLTTYWFDRNWTSGYVWVKNGECKYVFDSDYSAWKPNFFVHSSHGPFYSWTIIVIPKDDIWKIGHPGWTIFEYYNPAGSHPRNIQEFLNDLNNSVNSWVTHFYGSNTYMLPMLGAYGTRLWTNYKVKEFWDWHGGNVINKDADDREMDVIKWYFNAKKTWKYCFGVDGDDYVGIYIDWTEVVAWPWWHWWDKNQAKYHNGCINLKKWFHNFVALHEELTWGSNWIFYVKNPGDSDYHVISPEKGEIYSVIYKNNWIDYDTVNNFYDYTLKWIKNKDWFWTVKNDVYNLINNIKYYWTQEATMDNETIVKYAYDLFLNHKLSIYNDDISQDINSFNNEFWLWQDKWVVYQLISSIDRIGGIRNFDVFYGGDDLSPKSIPNIASIPSYYYTKDQNQIWYDTNSIDFAYQKWMWFSPWGLRWRRYKIDWYLLYSDLTTYWRKNKLAISSTVSSYYYSSDQDLGATAYSDWTKYNRTNFRDFKEWYLFLQEIKENPDNVNRSQEYRVCMHKKNYEGWTNDLSCVNAAKSWHALALNDSFILDSEKHKVYQNDMIWYLWYDNSEIDKQDWNDIWVYSNDGDNDTNYTRFKNYYVDFKAYYIYRNSNKNWLWLTKNNPALSCHEIYKVNPNSSNGYYWIKLDNSHTYKLFCDFRTPFEWITQYLDIYGDVNFGDAKKCFLGNYILNNAMECYNPNRYNAIDNVDKLYVFNNWSITQWDYWIYDTHENRKSYTTEIATSNYRSVWHPDFMTLMQRGSYPNPNTGSNTRRVRLGINFAKKYYNNTKIEDKREFGGVDAYWKNQNYSEDGRFGYTPWGREDTAKPGKIFWKELIDINPK